jgi:hypothetical protein
VGNLNEHRLREFEKRIMKTFGPQGTGSDRITEKTAYVEVHNLFPSPNIIRVVKSRTMKAGNVTRMREIHI